MKIKTSALTTGQLDYLLATFEGLPIRLDPMGFGSQSPGGYWIWPGGFPPAAPGYMKIGKEYSPSTDWAQGGPIIERENIGVTGPSLLRAECAALANHCEAEGRGPTYLIAAMRCYVASKLGDEVEVPDSLVTP